jgi:hypothetical protein
MSISLFKVNNPKMVRDLYEILTIPFILNKVTLTPKGPQINPNSKKCEDML